MSMLVGELSRLELLMLVAITRLCAKHLDVHQNAVAIRGMPSVPRMVTWQEVRAEILKLKDLVGAERTATTMATSTAASSSKEVILKGQLLQALRTLVSLQLVRFAGVDDSGGTNAAHVLELRLSSSHAHDDVLVSENTMLSLMVPVHDVQRAFASASSYVPGGGTASARSLTTTAFTSDPLQSLQRLHRLEHSLANALWQLYSALAEQLMSVKSASFGLNFEALQTCFKHSCIDGSPTIIIVDDIHEFASRPRQVLLYALLDLIHRKECLFMVMVIHMQYLDIIMIQVMEHVDLGDWINGPRGHRPDAGEESHESSQCAVHAVASSHC